MPEVQIQEMQSTCSISSLWRPASTSLSADGEPELWRLRAVRERYCRPRNARDCHSLLRIYDSSTYQAVSVMARPHALVANLMTRFVHMKSIRSPRRQSFDQGELPLRPH